MPIIRIEMFPGRSNEQKGAFAKAVTDSFVTLCGGTPQSVHIVFQDVTKDNWAVAGKLVVDNTAPPPSSPQSK